MMKGTVVEKTYDPDGVYFLTVDDDAPPIRLMVDRNVYEELNVRDQVNLLYLPVRREAVRCELIERFAE